MTATPSAIIEIWANATPGSILEVAGLMALGAGLHLLQLRLRTKGAAGVLAVGKWLAVFGALRALDSRVLRHAYETPMLVLYGFAGWMTFRALLRDVYADLYLSRIKRRPANKIILSLLSLFAAVILVGYGLRSVLNVDVGSLLTSSAILTAVIGFSMQDTLGSLFSGLLIQAERPFAPGDWVRVGEVEGQVSEITWRYTLLTTRTQDRVLIPNNTVAKERVVNLSEPIPQVSVAVSVPAPLDAPPVKVKSALEDVLRKASLVAKVPPPAVRLTEIGLDQLTYRLSFFVRDFGDMSAAKSEVLSGVWYEFKKQCVEFPMSRHLLLARRKAPCATGLDVATLVGGVGLFKGMPPDELELLAQCSAVRVYPPQARIVERGQTGSTMFIIVAGEVAVSLEDTEVARLGPGDVFGEMALLTGEPRLADVTALGPVSCLEVDREAFRGVLEKNPVLVANVTRVFEERISRMRDATRAGAHESAEGLFERFRRIFW